MRFTVILISVFLWRIIAICSELSAVSTSNDNIINENQIKKYIHNIDQDNINHIEKEQIINQLKSALCTISEIQDSKIKIQEYKNIIDNFPTIIHQLYYKKEKIDEEYLDKYNNKNNQNIISSNELRKHQTEISQQLATLDQELQQAQNLSRSINHSLTSLPQQHTETKKKLNEINRKISSINTTKKLSYLEKAKLIALQIEKQSKEIKISELELAQLSGNNRQEISRLHIEALKNKYDQLNKIFHQLHIQLHHIRMQETANTIENMEMFSNITKKRNIIFPKIIVEQIQINHELSQSLKKQIEHINSITLQQRKIDLDSLKTREALSKLLEQSQWIIKSTALGEILRAQISKLPQVNFKTQQLNSIMSTLHNKRLQYEEQINNLPTISSQYNHTKHTNLTKNQTNILNTQINIQRKLLNSLLTNYDIQILELTKLKISYEQLQELTKDINKAIHHHLFWIADTQPINLSYLYKIYQDLYLIFKKNILYQLIYTMKTILSTHIMMCTLLSMYFLLICLTYTTYHKYYYLFLEQSKIKLNINKQKYFLLTLKNIFWSSIIALPIPILYFILGCLLLQQTWEYPISHVIGKTITNTSPILWLLIIIRYFSSKNGLFILYFKWEKTIKNISYHYEFLIITITFTLIILVICNNYNNKEFYSTIGRLCFIILCFCLSYITYIVKKSNFPLYINKHESSNNIINHSLWNIMIILPIISASASYFGYLSTFQTLLINIEISLAICLISSIIYFTIQCWVITQKNQILYKYQQNNNTIPEKYLNTNKQFSSPITHNTHYSTIINAQTDNNKIKKNTTQSKITLNTISNQSLQFIKFMITFIALTIILFLWSEFHSIFKFLEKITLWDITFNIQHTNNIQHITLQTLLITILIFFITIKFTKNIPSLIEITILQHLDFTPGTNYAILTLMKYTLMILGVTIGCTYIGFQWSKLQWLIAAIGVGLGFGLQEIFANFISGLIVLFEKPIRIGDTVTICDFTGNITKINTRATTILDRDHKEIIIPNKEFITQKFINWSLSDTITRVVLKIPAPSEVNVKKIINILLKSANHCPLVLKTPKPEVYLINIQQNILLFEIRMHTTKMQYRMPIRHQVHILITRFYKKHGIKLPLPHMYIYKN